MTDLPFGFDRPKASPGFLLWQTSITWQRRIRKALEPHGISHPQFVIMAIVLWLEAHEGPPSQTKLIQWSKLDKMTVSSCLKKLKSMGLVERKEDELDTRSKLVSLTQEGKTLIHQLVPIVEAVDAQFFGQLNDEEQQMLLKLLDKLTHTSV